MNLIIYFLFGVSFYSLLIIWGGGSVRDEKCPIEESLALLGFVLFWPVYLGLLVVVLIGVGLCWLEEQLNPSNLTKP